MYKEVYIRFKAFYLDKIIIYSNLFECLFLPCLLFLSPRKVNLSHIKDIFHLEKSEDFPLYPALFGVSLEIFLCSSYLLNLAKE